MTNRMLKRGETMFRTLATDAFLRPATSSPERRGLIFQ